MAMNSDDASNQLKARLAASAGSSGLNKSLRIENGGAKGPFNLVAAFAAGHHHGVREAGTELAQIRAERDALRDIVIMANEFIQNGIELGHIRLSDTPDDPAYHTPRIVQNAADGVKRSRTLESLIAEEENLESS